MRKTQNSMIEQFRTKQKRNDCIAKNEMKHDQGENYDEKDLIGLQIGIQRGKMVYKIIVSRSSVLTIKFSTTMDDQRRKRKLAR